MSMHRKALFLDRDGVINVDHGYVHTPDQCEFVEGIYDVLVAAKEKDYLVIVVTNQAGIGRGYYTEEAFLQLMGWMNNQLGNNFDDVYFCPYHPTHGLGVYKKASEDRKPNPGMLLRAMKEHQIDPALSLMVGDKESDLLAANKAKVRHFFLLGSQPIQNSLEHTRLDTLTDVLPFL